MVGSSTSQKTTPENVVSIDGKGMDGGKNRKDDDDDNYDSEIDYDNDWNEEEYMKRQKAVSSTSKTTTKNKKAESKVHEKFARKLQQGTTNEENVSSSSSVALLMSMSVASLRKELKEYGVDSSYMIEKHELATALEAAKATGIKKENINEEKFSSSSSTPLLILMSVAGLRKELKSYGVDSSYMIEKHELVTALEAAKATGMRKENYTYDNDLVLARRLQEKESRRTITMKPPTKEQVIASLEPCQLAAVNHVKLQAKKTHEEALPKLMTRIKTVSGHSIINKDLIECLDYIRDDAPVIIHMTENTLSFLVHDTHYRNQFETNTSGGTIDHSARQTWERRMFGTCYDSVYGRLRVKYGCLNLSGDIAGVKSARRYGPLFMVLHSHIRHRTTFFNKDTGGAFYKADAISPLATNEYYAHILNEYDDNDLKSVLDVCKSARVGGAPSNCTEYKEVQIHGPVCLATDIQALSIPGRQKNANKQLLKKVEKFRTKTNCNILWQEDLLDPVD